MAIDLGQLAQVDPLLGIFYATTTYWVSTGDALPGGLSGPGYFKTELLWIRMHGAERGGTFQAGLGGPKRIATDWDFKRVFQGASGRIYAADENGDLLWYDHRGHVGGTNRMSGPKDVGNGFIFWNGMSGDLSDNHETRGYFFDPELGINNTASNILASHQVVYSVKSDGSLYWYRHDGARNGEEVWANNGNPIKVSSNIAVGCSYIFSGSFGVVYVVTDSGDLLWYRHIDYLDGGPGFIGPKKLSSGWDRYSQIFCVGKGVIYGVDHTNGHLYWHKHLGYTDGANKWQSVFGDRWNADPGERIDWRNCWVAGNNVRLH